MFNDLLDANAKYQAQFVDPGVPGRAGRELAVVTCIDSRIDPLAMLGLQPGDAKIIRNAGARITDDTLRSLILSTNLPNARRICVVQHTDCAVAGSTEEQMRSRVAEATGKDTGDWQFLANTDQKETVREDIAKIRACELIPADTQIGAFIFDVHTGALTAVDQIWPESAEG